MPVIDNLPQGSMVDTGSNSSNGYGRLVNQMVNEATNDSRYKLANEIGLNPNLIDSSGLDYLTQGMINSSLAEKAFNRELKADSEKYQRAMKDMIAAGLNPAQVLGSLSGSNPGYSPASVSGGYFTQSKNNQRDAKTKIGVGIGAALAMAVTALIKVIAG